MKAKHVKIALVSTGLSQIQRGYETFILDLYEVLRDVADVRLYKGSGWGRWPRVIQLPCIHRSSRLAHKLNPDDENRRYRVEQLSMVASGWLFGNWQRNSIIHFCDPVFGNGLLRLRNTFKHKYQVLFANCGPAKPADYRKFDHIQEFTPQYLEMARQSIRKTKLTLIPMGVWTERFQLATPKADSRRAWGIPEDKLVVLCVASMDEPYKRISFLIETLAAMQDPNLFLLMVGQNQGTPYAQQTLTLAAEKLPAQHLHINVPYKRIAELYQAADLFILPSLQEGFGKVYLEAMAAKKPLLCHNSPNTHWIVNNPASLVNMEDSDAVMNGIRRLTAQTQSCSSLILSDTALDMAEKNYAWVNERFHWQRLRDEYLQMYERVMYLPS